MLVRRKAEKLLGLPDLVLTEGLAVSFLGVGAVRRRPADVAAEHDQRGLVRHRHPAADGSFEPVEVVGDLTHLVDVPPVGSEPPRDVVGVSQLRRAVDGDVVVVVDGDEAPEAEVPGERARLVADPFHEVAVAAEGEDVVVAGLRPETRPQPALGDGHPDGVADPLPERACGDLHARCVPSLRVAGRPAAELAERLQVVDRQAVAGEEEHRVEQDRGVPVRQDETIPVGPLGSPGVVTHDARPKHVGHRRQRHGGAGMARVGVLRSVHGQAADDVDGEFLELAIRHDRSLPAVSRRSRWRPGCWCYAVASRASRGRAAGAGATRGGARSWRRPGPSASASAPQGGSWRPCSGQAA